MNEDVGAAVNDLTPEEQIDELMRGPVAVYEPKLPAFASEP
jgi:hypothetical protein